MTDSFNTKISARREAARDEACACMVVRSPAGCPLTVGRTADLPPEAYREIPEKT